MISTARFTDSADTTGGSENRSDYIITRIEKYAGDFRISAYTAGRVEENWGDPCMTAYGVNICRALEQGDCGFATRAFEYGTLLKIGNMECYVLDKTSAKYADTIDIATLDYDQAIEFGVRYLPVYIIENYGH